MKKIFLITLLFLIWNKLVAQTIEFNYPKSINTLQLKKLFDSTKWCLYCMECDVDVPFSIKSNIKDRFTYGQLPLRFDTLSVRGDTIEINFKFYYKGKPVNSFVTDPPVWGRAFVKGKNRIVMYSSTGDARYYIKRNFDPKTATARQINPLQPEVRAYIIKNKTTLDPWFLEAAKKHHVFK